MGSEEFSPFRFSSLFRFFRFSSFFFVFLRFSSFFFVFCLFSWNKGKRLQFTGKMGNFTPTPSAPTPFGTSRNVVLAQVLAKMWVLASVLAQVLASCFVSVFPKGPDLPAPVPALWPAPPFLPAPVPAPLPALFWNSHFGVLYQVAGISIGTTETGLFGGTSRDFEDSLQNSGARIRATELHNQKHTKTL